MTACREGREVERLDLLGDDDSACVSVCRSYLCECCTCTVHCASEACHLSRSPWWNGGHVAQVLFSGRHLKLLNVLLDQYSLMFTIYIFVIIIVYTVIFLLLIYFVHMTSIACLSVLGEGSLLHCSS